MEKKGMKTDYNVKYDIERPVPWLPHTGGAGNDYLVGNAGNNVYEFNRDDGHVTGNAVNDSEWRVAA
jgi:Ca2+-binding RTX toxin-like protein